MDLDTIEKAMLFYIITGAKNDLTAEDFTGKQTIACMRAIEKIQKSEQELNAVNVAKILGDNTLGWVTSLYDYTLGLSEDVCYKRIVEEKKKRQLTNLALMIPQMIKQDEDINISIQNTIKDLTEITKRAKEEKTFKEQLSDTLVEIEGNYTNRRDYTLYSGIFALDNLTLGFHRGELTILGARPRRWKNNASLTDSYQDCKSKKESFVYIFRNVRRASNSKTFNSKNTDQRLHHKSRFTWGQTLELVRQSLWRDSRLRHGD